MALARSTGVLPRYWRPLFQGRKKLHVLGMTEHLEFEAPNLLHSTVVKTERHRRIELHTYRPTLSDILCHRKTTSFICTPVAYRFVL